MPHKEHKKSAKKNHHVAILSVSSTRSLADDKSGWWMHRNFLDQGHHVLFHEIVPDDTDQIKNRIDIISSKVKPDLLITSGGTGIAKQDVTIEAVRPFFDKEISAFSTLFAMLSFQEIGSSALLSRAVSGLILKMVVFCLPGSENACRLACEKLIFPEIGHLIRHAVET